jgi:hypothetical protein
MMRHFGATTLNSLLNKLMNGIMRQSNVGSSSKAATSRLQMTVLQRMLCGILCGLLTACAQRQFGGLNVEAIAPKHPWRVSPSLSYVRRWVRSGNQELLIGQSSGTGPLLSAPFALNISILEQHRIDCAGDSALEQTGKARIRGTPEQFRILRITRYDATYWAVYLRPEAAESDSEAEKSLASLCKRSSWR